MTELCGIDKSDPAGKPAQSAILEELKVFLRQNRMLKMLKKRDSGMVCVINKSRFSWFSPEIVGSKRDESYGYTRNGQKRGQNRAEVSADGFFFHASQTGN